MKEQDEFMKESNSAHVESSKHTSHTHTAGSNVVMLRQCIYCLYLHDTCTGETIT